jgi:hypothetical protein
LLNAQELLINRDTPHDVCDLSVITTLEKYDDVDSIVLIEVVVKV